MNDDTEVYTSQFAIRVTEDWDVDVPVLMRWFKIGAPGRVVSRAGRQANTLPSILLPNHVEHNASMEALENFSIVGKNIILKVEVVLQPPIVVPTLGRRWLEEYSPPPRNKAVQRKMRFALLDGILAGLRAAITLASVVLIGIGEGALVLMGLLSSEARQAAYKERHVPDPERLSLEEAAAALTHVVIICPHSYPVKSYMPLLREFVPEICCVVPHSETFVLVVAPSRDALHNVSQECSTAILGSVLETVKFKGPAYRTLPDSPLALFQLLKKAENVKLPIETAGRPPREVAETWAGCAILTTELIRVGFVGRAYESRPHDAVHLPEGDVSRAENQSELENKIVTRQLYQLHNAPDCSSWSIIQNLNKTSRTADCPQGDGKYEHEVRGNSSIAIAMWLIWLCICHGVFFAIEHPLLSRIWKLPFFRYLIEILKLFVIDLDQCAY